MATEQTFEQMTAQTTEQTPNKCANDLLSIIGKSLYLDEETADVTFIFQSQDGLIEKVPAHKCHLTAVSENFKEMFEKSCQKKEIRIAGTSATSFKEFLKFFYFGSIQLTWKNIFDIMILSKRYEIPQCMEVCEKVLRRGLNDETVCAAYRLAVLFKRDELKKTCEQLIGLHAKAVLKLSGFLHCKRTVLEHILKIDAMACSESELFEGCMNWVFANSKEKGLSKELVQMKFGDLCNEIRFGAMSFEEFFTVATKYGQYMQDDFTDIIRMMGSREYQPTLGVNPNRERRSDKSPWSEGGKLKCNRLASKYCLNEPYYVRDEEITTFSSDDLVLLSGFTLNIVYEYRRNDYSDIVALSSELTIVELTDAKQRKGQILFSERANFTGPKFNYVLPTQPILIRPGFFYQIRLKQNPRANSCTGGMLMTSVRMKSSATIQFYNDSKLENDPNVARGLISGLKFFKI